MKKRGFTLIELLVVIAIIGVLSSIVLFAVAGAKIKALNSARNQQVEQLRNALALYKSDNGSYFNDGEVYTIPINSVNVGMISCTGDINNRCISIIGNDRYNYPFYPGRDYGVNSSLSSDLSHYIQMKWKDNYVITYNYPDSTEGITYQCTYPETSDPTKCGGVGLMWAVQNSKDCGIGIVWSTGPNGTNCRLDM